MPVEIAGTTLYTLQEISQQLQVSLATLRGYIEKGRLHAVRVGRSYRVSEEALRAFLQPVPPGELAPPEDPQADPILRVIGIGEDGTLSRDIDSRLYD